MYIILKVLVDTVCFLQVAIITHLLTYLVIYLSVGATEYRLSQSLALALEAKSLALALRVVALTLSLFAAIGLRLTPVRYLTCIFVNCPVKK